MKRTNAPVSVKVIAALASVTALGGCATMTSQKVAKGEAPIILGPSVRNNYTPMGEVFACFADRLAASKEKPLVIGVGDVKDYTGKYSINEGNAITQGGSLMVYSALGKLSGTVRIAERFDPTIAERELGYMNQRQLGDGRMHDISGAKGSHEVPWLPYYGGSIEKSDYFIVGGITELNYDISSGGVQAGVDQIGAKGRIYTESVSIDLRIVNTRTLMVAKTVSLTKQFSGYEVGFNIFRFFGSHLFDINLGAKGQEPLQLGIRTALEDGVVRLVSAVTKVNYKPCMSYFGSRIVTTAPADLRKVKNPPVDTSAALHLREPAMNVEQATDGHAAGAFIQVPFAFGSADLSGQTLNVMDQIAAKAKNGVANVMIVSRDTENFDPGKRDRLTNQRISAVSSALASRGIPLGAIQVTWRPDPADTSIHRDGPGLQENAKLKIGG